MELEFSMRMKMKQNKIMNEDPGVKAGVFIYEIHSCCGFPGDSLQQ